MLTTEAASDSIAIVGMACRMPGARDVTEFWANLRDGIQSFSRFSEEELLGSGIDPALVASPHYVRSRGIIGGADAFDAAFFGFNPREAELIDPQQRVFLECAWHALEDAGYVPGEHGPRIGVFGGVGTNWHLGRAAASPVVRKFASGTSVVIANDKDYVTTRVSFKLGLTGPSVNVQTACSTSLVATLLGMASLRAHHADMVLAGGATIEIPEKKGYLHQEGGMESADGICRPFDAAANGTVFSRGAGVVVLKRLGEAIRNRDHIYAVILDGAVNNDGAAKMGFTAPSVAGQLELAIESLERAGISADEIDFVEAHGTATPLGDPIEVEALSQAFRHYSARTQYCALGSVKGNIGHTDVASGLAGLIKSAKAIEQRLLPASLNYSTPNPKIDFASSPFFVNTSPRRISGDKPVRGLLSSFGVGGTNASMVLESAPRRESVCGPAHNVALLSARTETALEAQAARLRAHLEANPDLDLAQVAYTLQVGRRRFAMRRYLPFENRDGLLQALATPAGAYKATCQREGAPVVFMFPGQGNQFPGMGRDQYRLYPVFRDAVDRAAALLEPILELDLRDILFAGADDDRAQRLIDRTDMTQPALYVIGYAQAMLWRSWGLEPDALVGHSVGEYVAACLAGVFTFEDGLRLVAARGRLVQSMPTGSMLAALLPEDQVLHRLPGGVEVAAVNSRQMTVVAGPDDAIAALASQLAAEGVVSRHLRTSHAFHSAMMEPAIPRFAGMFDGIRLHAPTTPIVSTLTGTWLTGAEATDPGYWARHMRAPVRFADAAEVLTTADEPFLFLECGPGHSLASSVKTLLDRAQHHRVLCSQQGAQEGNVGMEVLMRAVGGLWAAGRPIDWTAFYDGGAPGRVPLPGYPFERQRFSLDFGLPDAPVGAPRDHRKEVGDWFYEPTWERTCQAALLPGYGADAETRCWLLFADPTAVAAALEGELVAGGHDVVWVERGDRFAGCGHRYAIRPGFRDDYDTLLGQLKAEGKVPTRLVHLWSAGEACGDPETARVLAFDSPLFLEQALIAHGTPNPVRLLIVTRGACSVAGEEVMAPLRALAAGPARVIEKEYPGIQARMVDIADGSGAVPLLVAEAALDSSDLLVAHRGRHRFVERFSAVRLDRATPLGRQLHNGGTYLITGGLGALGLFFAQAFAAAARVNLVLVHRSDLPDREHWDGMEFDPDLAERTAAVRALEAAGAMVMLAKADVADAKAMAAVVAEAERRFGPIRGVIHSAGSAGGGIIALKTPEMTVPVLRPKIEGTLAIAELFHDRPVDFVWLFSSITAVLGEPGRVDYCAGNAVLDALAQQWAQRRPGVMRSLAWSGWAEIGMASRWEKRKARNLAAGARPRRSAPDGWLKPVARDDGSEILEVLVDPDKDWIVSEHLVFGVPTLVGTSFLEFTHRYAALRDADAGVEVVNAYFIAPLMFQPHEARRLRMFVTGERISFRSQPTHDAEAPWQDHFVCELKRVPVELPSRREPGSLRSRFARVGSESYADLSSVGSDGRPLLTFGPRWRVLEEVALGAGEWLSALRLPDTVGDDFGAFDFHPALLDVALASGRFQMARAAAIAGDEDGHYLPLGYRRVRLLKPLRARAWSHVRLVGDHRPGAETISFDVAVLDEDGTECVSITGYTLKKVNLATQVAQPAPRAEPAVLEAATDDIRRNEGLDALQRVLAAPFAPHLVITPKDLDWQVEDTSPAALARSARAKAAARADSRGDHSRDALGTPFEQPENEIEAAIAEIWAGILGVKPIGATDDFIALGGNSLLAVQMVTVTSEAFSVDLAIDSFFKNPTVRGLGKAVVEHLIALADPDELDALIADLEDSPSPR